MEILRTKEFTEGQRSSTVNYLNMPNEITSQESKSSTKNTAKKPQNNIGGLWLKESSNNKKYLSGKITIDTPHGKIVQNIVILKNQFKQKNSHPDYIVFQPIQLEK